MAMQMEPDAEGRRGLPDMLHDYHSLYPLEDAGTRADQPSAVFGVPTLMFKGISLQNGQGHAIRRIDGRQVQTGFHLAVPSSLASACIKGA